MRKSQLIFAIILLAILFLHCSSEMELGPDIPNNPGDNTPLPERTQIEASAQRSGDADKGWDYLVNGNYVSSGVPLELYTSLTAPDNENLLGRSGDNATLSPEVTAVTHSNGTKIVSPNCLTCHAEKLNGELIVGLGNTTFDYTTDMSNTITLADFAVTSAFGTDSPEWEAYERFSVASKEVNKNILMDARGVNPADQLTAVLVAHRDPKTLEWRDEPALEIPSSTLPTDVPAWWLLKKKNAMFYAGIGRGDFSKFLMASSLLTLESSDEAAEIDEHFVDVLAWINSLEAPDYPGDIDQSLAADGKLLFNLNCAGCHGTQGPDGDYLNLLIPVEEVGTDPTLVSAYKSETFGGFVDWYNESWFAQGDNPGEIVTSDGYVAPPLDGVWATAPYLHNGSVPDLASLLDSSLRPTYWERSFNTNDYNLDKLGWNYEQLDSKVRKETYDTTLPGYGNGGHTFGDDLSDGERVAVMEYLKSL